MRQSGSPGVAHRAWLIGRGSSGEAHRAWPRVAEGMGVAEGVAGVWPNTEGRGHFA